MRKYIVPIVEVVALGIATTASAYDSGDLISMQEALSIATELGLVTVSHTEFAGDEWQIEGGICQADTWRLMSTPPRVKCLMSTGSRAGCVSNG